VVVVLGSRAEELRNEVPPGVARVVVNRDFALGQSTSFRAGLAALVRSVDGAVCYPADQPFVTAQVIRRLVDAHQHSGRPVVVAEASGIRGAPVFLSRSVFSQAMAARGDQGARELVRSQPELVHVEHFDDPDLMLDIDTPDDYRALLARRT
jgi:CTP:molybdopterin cytidylyltransferase MocA